MTCHLRLLLQNALSGPTWKRARGVYSETRSSQTSCYWSAKSHRPDKDEPLSRQQLSRFVLRTGREHARRQSLSKPHSSTIGLYGAACVGKYATRLSSACFAGSLPQRMQHLRGPTLKLTCAVDDWSRRRSN